MPRRSHWRVPLAYASLETGRAEVYVRPFPEADRARWTVSSGGGTEPQWSRDGRELYYRDGAGRLVAVGVGAGAVAA